MIIRNFTCQRDVLTIRGTEFLPDGDNLPVAVISHGFTANQKSAEIYAIKLAELGFAAYTFDFCGGCLEGSSDGNTIDMSVLTEAEDLVSVINYAASRSYTDNNRIILAGISQGGFVSAYVAANYTYKIEKLILLCPALCIPEDAAKGSMHGFDFDPEAIPDTVTCRGFTIGRRYITDALSIDIFEDIRKYHGPVLLIHGNQDEIVNIQYAEKCAHVLGSYCKFTILKDEKHRFSMNGVSIALKELEGFLQ